MTYRTLKEAEADVFDYTISGGDFWCLSIQRTIEQRPLSEVEKRQFAELSNRLSASAALARALGAPTAAGSLQAFEASEKAVVLFTATVRHIDLTNLRKSHCVVMSGLKAGDSLQEI
jgi:hypothetical protein